MLSQAAGAVRLNDLVELSQLAGVVEACMSVNARSIADLDRRIERLEGRGGARSSEQAGALREARAYAVRNNLLPETAPTRRTQRPQGADQPARRSDAGHRAGAASQQSRRRDGREER